MRGIHWITLLIGFLVGTFVGPFVRSKVGI